MKASVIGAVALAVPCLLQMLASSCAAQEPIQLSFSDETSFIPAPVVSPNGELLYTETDLEWRYPNAVNDDPGRPQKPHIDRPGDRDRSACPPERYCIPDDERSGHPQQVAWWARPAINKNYSACYVGGGTAWVLPWLARPRCRYEEGTWGMDYDGLYKPRRVWLRWSGSRPQGGRGQYDADYEPKLVSFLKEHAGHSEE